MMARVYYWRDVVGDFQLFAPYEDEIERLLLGEYASLSLERLHGVVNPPIYSIRTNRETRILFTTYQGKVCLLDVVEHHDYHKSRFLRDKRVLKAFLNRLDEVDEVDEFDTNTPFVDVAEIETLAQGDESSVSDMTALDYYQRRLIQLNGNQQEVLKASLPAMVYGPAGSGKSCVALTMLVDYVRSHREDEDAFPVVYVTQSRPLLEDMKRLWQEAGGRDEAVCFKTYTEVQQAQLSPECSLTDDLLFTTWFEGWYSLYQKRHRVSSGTSLQPLNSETVWREFRIHSGYDLEAYLHLGVRQSELDVAVRKIIAEAYDAYMAYLAEHHWVSPELSPLGSGDYRLVVVDEAQDFSYGQLKGLNQLAQGSVVYFLGDHQVLFDGKSRWFYLHELFRSEGLTPSEIALPTTYRCCERVIQVANALIQLKYQVTGGHADGVESSQLTIAPDVAGVVGESLWLSSNAKDIAGLQTEVSSAKFAVVTWPEHFCQAQEVFKTPLVFTPKEIKGLEYDTVVIWRPMDRDEAKQASQKLLHVKPGTRQHRAKAGESDESLLPYFNELITAVTRARFRMVMVQDKRHAIEALASALQKATQPVVSEPVMACSGGASGGALNDSEWEDEAKRLLRNEDIARARQIFTETLRRTESDFQVFMATHQTKSTTSVAMPSLAAGAASAAEPSRHKKNSKRRGKGSKRSAPVLIDADVTTHQMEPTASEVMPAPITSVPSPVLTGPKLALKLIEEQRLQLTPEIEAALGQDGSEGIEKTFLYHLVMRPKGADLLSQLLRVHRHLVDIIPRTVWGKSVSSSVLINTTPLYWLTQYEAGLPVISLLLEHYPDIILAIPAVTWGLARPKIAGLDANTSPLYWLSLNKKGQEIIAKFVVRYPLLVDLIPASAWGLARSMDAGCFANTTPIYWLTETRAGLDIIKDLVENHKALVQSIPYDVWSLVRPEGIGSGGHLTPFYWLTMSELGTHLLCLLTNCCPEFIQSIPGSTWALPRTAEAGLQAFFTPLLVLLLLNDGQNYFNWLMEAHPEVIRSIPAKAWSFPLSDCATLAPLYQLAGSEDGNLILTKLLNDYPDIVNAIPVGAWSFAMSVGDEKNVTPVYWLTANHFGHKILQLLIEHYPKIVSSIPPETWWLARPKENEECPFITPLYWLLSLGNFDVFKLLMKHHPQVLEAIPPEAWSLTIPKTASKEYARNSLLSRLVMTDEARSVLLDLINGCPKVISMIPASAWMSMVETHHSKRVTSQVSAASLLTSDENGMKVLLQLQLHHATVQHKSSVELSRLILKLIESGTFKLLDRDCLMTQSMFGRSRRSDRSSSDVHEASFDFGHK